jgi:hypothetical protein
MQTLPSKLARILAGPCFLLCLCALHAQSNLGTIQGSVTDSTGAAIVDAQVTATNTATNAVQQSVTNSKGIYVFPFLQPGTYDVTAMRNGFQSANHTNILLHVADSLTIDFSLQVGSTTANVTVDATTPLINTSSASLGQIIDNQRIVDLPLDGRDPISLAGLSSGVVPVPPNANIHQGDNTPSINGAANFTSEVMVDGVPDTTPRNSALNNFLIYTPTVDTVAEFKVETNSLSAQYGRFNGGVIDVILKSGSNSVHGSVYEFIRNSATDANYFFNNRSDKPLPPLKRNQFGFTVSWWRESACVRLKVECFDGPWPGHQLSEPWPVNPISAELELFDTAKSGKQHALSGCLCGKQGNQAPFERRTQH